MTGQGTQGTQRTQGAQAAAAWLDPDFARSWADGDSLRDLLDFPRRMAAGIVAGDNPAPQVIVDIAAGPGAVLAVFLERFPQARGTWSDASRAMLAMAEERLAPYGDRVDFRLADMTALDDAGLPAGADVITTSRATHHLDRAGLISFYAAAAERLKPGGWLVNLDHIGPDEVWDQRLRAARKAFGVGSDGPKHHHNYPLTSVQDHLDALGMAGFTDVEVPWRAFVTCLFMGRKAG
jgi:trans-aconitate methyltransferase